LGIVKSMRVILTTTIDTIEIMGELDLGERRCPAAVPRSRPPQEGVSAVLRTHQELSH